MKTFELGDTAADIQWRREAREREEAWQQQQREEEARREGARAEESHSKEEGVAKERPRKERSDTETEAAGVEAGTSQLQYKKGHMTNIYLTDFDKEAIVDFLKDYEELKNKTNEHFKDKARKQCL